MMTLTLTKSFLHATFQIELAVRCQKRKIKQKNHVNQDYLSFIFFFGRFKSLEIFKN